MQARPEGDAGAGRRPSAASCPNLNDQNSARLDAELARRRLKNDFKKRQHNREKINGLMASNSKDES